MVLGRRRCLPASVLRTGHHLEHVKGEIGDLGLSDDAARWQNATLAPFACPLWRGGGTDQAGYVEIKVVASPPAPRPTGYLANYSDTFDSTDRGYIILSLERSDLPLLEYNTSGPTPSERLLRRCGGRAPRRIVRYGPAFWVAEDAAGNLMANLGTEPFKPPYELTRYMDRVYTGAGDENTPQLPPDMKIGPGRYGSYFQLKQDFQNNPVHQLLRQRRFEIAQLEWGFVEGVRPEVLQVKVGETKRFLESQHFSDYCLGWEDTDAPLADPLARVGSSANHAACACIDGVTSNAGCVGIGVDVVGPPAQSPATCFRGVPAVRFRQPGAAREARTDHCMKTIKRFLMGAAGLGLVCGCISHHETIYQDVPRAVVRFENDKAARLFYETLNSQSAAQDGRESRTKIELPIVFEHETRVVKGPNVAFNDAVARCDTDRDGLITEAEAQIYASQKGKH